MALVGGEQPKRHQQTDDAEIQGRPEFLTDCKKAQVVNSHAEYGAENEKVEAALYLIEPADLGLRPQRDQIPWAAPAVMKIGNLQKDFDLAGIRLERHDRRKLSGHGGRGRHSGQAGRKSRPPVDENRVGRGDFLDF